MKILFAIPVFIAFMIWPWLTATIAKTFGRKFNVWFALGLVLPFISLVILHCLPDKSRQQKLSGAENHPLGRLRKLQNSKHKISA